MTQKSSSSENGFFLASFLPAIGYWILDAYFSLEVALAGGIFLSVLEIAFEKWKFKKVHALSKFNFYIMVFLGAISFLGKDGIWFKLQPAISLFAVAMFMGFKVFKKESLFLDMIPNKEKLNEKGIHFFRLMERDLVIFMFVYGVVMAVVAIFYSNSVWIFFKTAGLYIAMGLFSLGEFFIRRKTLT